MANSEDGASKESAAFEGEWWSTLKNECGRGNIPSFTIIHLQLDLLLQQATGRRSAVIRLNGGTVMCARALAGRWRVLNGMFRQRGRKGGVTGECA
jgi:hypothetical protein